MMIGYLGFHNKKQNIKMLHSKKPVQYFFVNLLLLKEVIFNMYLCYKYFYNFFRIVI